MTSRSIAARSLALLAPGAMLATGASAAHAQSRELQTLWMVQPVEPPKGERDLAAGDFVVKQRLLPSGMTQLDAAVTLGKETLPPGTQLIEVTTSAAKVFCTTSDQRGLTGPAHKCLIDENRDGAFESWFNGASQTKALPTIAGNLPRRPHPIAAVRYTAVDPAAMHDTYFVAIERRNFFNIYNLESFQIAFGREGRLDRLTTPESFKSADMPKTMQIMGAQFTAISETGGKMRIRVEAAMPAQPFGVVKTTTVRFY